MFPVTCEPIARTLRPFCEEPEELVALAIAEPFPSARHEPAGPVQRIVLPAALAELGLWMRLATS